MKTLIIAAIRCFLLFLAPSVTYAISAQWDLDPISRNWNTAANWTPMGIPNGAADTATFGLSNTTNVSISADTEVNAITFTSAATNPYTITARPGLTLTISGVGIVNNSGTTQNFVTDSDTAGHIKFANNATAGNGTAFTNSGSVEFSNTSVEFFNSSTAGSATFTNEGGVTFNDTSSAANGIFNNSGGTTFFQGSSTAGNATFVNNGGGTIFFNSSTAGNATITNKGATPSTPEGGTLFSFTSTAGSATINNN